MQICSSRSRTTYSMHWDISLQSSAYIECGLAVCPTEAIADLANCIMQTSTSVKSLEISGLQEASFTLNTKYTSALKRLHIQHIGAGLRLETGWFPQLEILHLEIDIRTDIKSHEDIQSLSFRSSTWSTLHTFVISLYGDEYYASYTLQSIHDSMNVSIPNCLSNARFLRCPESCVIHLGSRESRAALTRTLLAITHD